MLLRAQVPAGEQGLTLSMCVILKARTGRVPVHTHPCKYPRVWGIVLGPCIQWPFQKGLCWATSISHFNLNFHLRFDEEKGAHFIGTGRE